MNSQLSSRDWEYLSAYLDRQLKPKEVASLEARLSTDPALSAALGELQRTRDALRGLPHLRAPRNFTLTPQMVGQRSPLRSRTVGRLALAFGFASALATFLLILVVVGDLLGILTPSTQPVAYVPALSPEVSIQQPTANLGGGVPTTTPVAPLVVKPQPATNPAVGDQATLQGRQAITSTAEVQLTVEATEVLTLSETVPAAQEMGSQAETQAETAVVTEAQIENVAKAMTETISAKEAAGMGSGMGEVVAEGDLPASAAILTPQGLMWNTIISVTVSPTETLMFPMTVTIQNPGFTVNYDAGVSGGPTEEPSMPIEPASTATLEEFPTPTEPPVPTEVPTEASTEPSPEPLVPAPNNTPEVVAHAVETATASQPERQTVKQVAAPTQTITPGLPVAQPDQTAQVILRIIEFSLALLALVTASIALYIWWARRV